MILEKICSRNGRNRWKKSVGKYNKKNKICGEKKRQGMWKVKENR